MTISEFCKRVGITPQTFHNFKNGANIGHETYFKMCEVLNIKTINL